MVYIGHSLDLLGAHVARRADHEPRPGEPIHPGHLYRTGDAEVDQHGSLARQNDVFRLHVAMDDPLRVGIAQCIEQIRCDLESVVDRHPANPGEVFPEGGALDVVHDVIDEQVGLAEVQEAGDVGMLHPPEEIDLSNEPLPGYRDRKLGVEHFQSDLPAVGGMGQKDARRSTAGDFALDGVLVAELVSDQRDEVAPDLGTPGKKPL